MTEDTGASADAETGSRADASSQQAVSTKGFDPARWRYHNGSDKAPDGLDDCAVDVVGTDGLLTEGWWPRNIVWKNVVRWRVHDDGGSVTPNVTGPDALAVMSLLYASEINCGIESFWDGGFTAFLGDDMNGRDAEEVFYPQELGGLAEWFIDTACGLYPDSAFARDPAIAMETRRADTPESESVAKP